MLNCSFDFLWCGSSRAFTLSAAPLSHISAIVSYLLAQTTESQHTATLTNDTVKCASFVDASRMRFSKGIHIFSEGLSTKRALKYRCNNCFLKSFPHILHSNTIFTSVCGFSWIFVFPPAVQTMHIWLIGDHKMPLGAPRRLPVGEWIICAVKGLATCQGWLLG